MYASLCFFPDSLSAHLSSCLGNSEPVTISKNLSRTWPSRTSISNALFSGTKQENVKIKLKNFTDISFEMSQSIPMEGGSGMRNAVETILNTLFNVSF